MYQGIVDRVRWLYRDVDRAIARYAGQEKIPCCVGCDHCCYQHVTACLAESILVVDSIRKDAELKKYFRSKIDDLKMQVSVLRDPNMSTRVWFNKQIPCIFLQDHKCLVYQDRPLVCRTHLVVEDTADGCAFQKEPPKIAILAKCEFIHAMIELGTEMREGFSIPLLYGPFQLSLLEAWEILENNKVPEKLPVESELAELAFWAQLELRE